MASPTTDSESDNTIAGWITRAERRMHDAGLSFGHGTASALDEAAMLVLHVAGLDPAGVTDIPERVLDDNEMRQIEAFLRRRINERKPAAYLIGRAWFAGFEFHVDERVLVPRSPIAELIEQRFEPWIDAGRVTGILDLCTGGGCIAIACALQFPNARVDALDISEDALEVARINVDRYELGKRVRLVRSDMFSALKDEQYDIIVSNPPYVGREEMVALPAEFTHEPELALASGVDGLDAVRVLLAGARRHLEPDGVLVVEVGNSEAELTAAYPTVPFTWLEFERGGSGVFLLDARDLDTHADAIALGVRN